MIERGIGSRGEMRYKAELQGSLDGLCVDLLLTPEKEITSASLVARFLDERGVVVTTNTFEVFTKPMMNEDQTMKMKVMMERKENGSKTEDVNLEHQAALAIFGAWFLQVLGIQTVYLADGLIVENEVLEDLMVGWWKDSRMDQFYENGRIELKGGMEIRIDVRSDWEDKGMVYVGLWSKDDEKEAECYLDASLERDADGKVFFAVETFINASEDFWKQNIRKKADLRTVAPEIAQTINLSEDGKAIDSVLDDPKEAMMLLTLRFLKQRHEDILVFDYTTSPLPLELNSADVRRRTDEWLSF